MSQSQEKPQTRYQGAARDGQKVLIQEWFNQLARSQEMGEKVGYVFVLPSAYELLRSFGIQALALPEVQALQCAVKKVAPQYLAKSEELGYSSDVCGYVKVDVGMMHMDMQHPLGHIPPPDLVVCPTSCNTYLKWVEIWKEYFNVPILVLDIPTRIPARPDYWGSEVFQQDRRYVMSQLEDLVEACQQVTGKPFNPEKLAEYEDQWNRVTDLWVSIVQMNQRIPALFDAFGDGLYYMGGMQASRGSDLVIPYLQEVKKELEERVALGIHPVAQERFRCLIDFAPCWSNLRNFTELFKKWGVVFVYATYMNMLVEPHFRYDVSRPLETLADSLLFLNLPSSTLHIFNRLAQIEDIVPDYKIDGVILHSIKSCRAVSGSIADYREHLTRKNIPALLLESDLVDARYYSEAQMRNRIDAFFESLGHKKLVGSGA